MNLITVTTERDKNKKLGRLRSQCFIIFSVIKHNIAFRVRAYSCVKNFLFCYLFTGAH
jgi:hypothetical protein